MATQPRRSKYRKFQKGQMKGQSAGGCFVTFGDFGMQAIGRGTVTAKQIEACRVAINRSIKKSGKIHIKIFPDKSLTRKPAETRMGKGKGGVDHWVAVIRPGRVLFEVAGVSMEQAKECLSKAAAKLNIPTRFVSRLERI
ncbi:MAG: 50S ribosomal protein L16 [Chlamydiia bacterium]|nr:50S ribosomal protein L16 [Chlamydiia bacterium]